MNIPISRPRLLALALLLAARTPLRAQQPALDSGKVYTFVASMPVYPGGGGWKVLLADLRREFAAASGPAGCAVPPFPVNVNLLVGPSGVIYRAEFVNNLPPPAKAPARGQNSVANTPPGPPLPAPCVTALAAAIRQLRRLRPGEQNGRRVTVMLMLPLVPRAKT